MRGRITGRSLHEAASGGARRVRSELAGAAKPPLAGGAGPSAECDQKDARFDLLGTVLPESLAAWAPACPPRGSLMNVVVCVKQIPDPAVPGALSASVIGSFSTFHADQSSTGL